MLLRPRTLVLPLALLLAGWLLASCATTQAPGAYRARHGKGYAGKGYVGKDYVKDSHPAIWHSNNAKVARFREHYRKTRTVDSALDQGRRYLPSILPAFQKRGLPEELAYLPMLESKFENRANSGHARGLWQFTKQTAEHMGLRVGAMIDERLNWRKASEAAAQYLDELGERYDYDWALALAAYNGGPGYLDQEIKSQATRDFFRLRLRHETAEYVPRYIAMLQVAREKQLVAER